MTERSDDERIDAALVYAHDTGFDEGYECGYDEGFRDGVRVTKTAYEEGTDEHLRALQG